MRMPMRGIVVALCATVLAAGSGCSSGGGTEPGPAAQGEAAEDGKHAADAEDAAETAGVAGAIAETEALAVLENYSEVNNAANEALDVELMATVEDGPLLQRSTAELNRLAALPPKEVEDYEEFFYQDPVFHVPPRQEAFPGWFLVTATSSRTENRRLLTFAETAAGSGQWRLVSALTPREGEELPEIAVGEDGLAEAVPSYDKVGELSPGAVPAAYEDLWATGGKHSGGLLAETPPVTDAKKAHAKQPADERMRRTFRAIDPEHPAVYALRTADGGALAVVPLAHHQEEATTQPGLFITPGEDAAFFDDTPRSVVTSWFYGEGAVHLPPEGQPRVLAATYAMTDAT